MPSSCDWSRVKAGKILIVDDDPDLCSTLSDRLAVDGYEVSAVTTGREGIEQLREDNFDLALVDLRMPGDNGIRIIRKLKEERPQIVTIAMTGYATLETAIEAIRAGAYDYVVKPFQTRQIKMAIERGLEHRKLLVENSKLTRSLAGANLQLSKNLSELERTSSEMIYALAATIDTRDPYTQCHSKQVHKYASILAKMVGLSSLEASCLDLASRLHDIGKIGIPDNILRKRSVLVEEEWECIKQHPKVGARILEPLRFLDGAVPLVLQHHERYDGKGYPDGLKGKSILLGARILAVADSFDAMISARPYRAAMTREEAARELRECSHTQFAPEVVEVAIFAFGGEKYSGDGILSTTEKASPFPWDLFLPERAGSP